MNIKDTALNTEQKSKVRNISELKSIDINSAVLEDTEAEFPYMYIEIDEERFKIPKSVLLNMKAILEENPNLKKFKVTRTGKGMDSRYTIIPLG